MIIRKYNLSSQAGVTTYVTQANNFMNLNVKLVQLQQGEVLEILASLSENAIDLLSGTVEVFVQTEKFEKTINMNRLNCFQAYPNALLADRFHSLKITALTNAVELLWVSVVNTKKYGYQVYDEENIRVDAVGVGEALGACNRKIIEFFNYQTMPDSKIVLGEVLCYPGAWASWPPHKHPQPEMYLFKFDKPQGFGVSFVGNQPYQVQNNDAVCIPGQSYHPTVAAPGYNMWYAWIIPNFKNSPWYERNYDPQHEWTIKQKIVPAQFK